MNEGPLIGRSASRARGGRKEEGGRDAPCCCMHDRDRRRPLLTVKAIVNVFRCEGARCLNASSITLPRPPVKCCDISTFSGRKRLSVRREGAIKTVSRPLIWQQRATTKCRKTLPSLSPADFFGQVFPQEARRKERKCFSTSLLPD